MNPLLSLSYAQCVTIRKLASEALEDAKRREPPHPGVYAVDPCTVFVDSATVTLDRSAPFTYTDKAAILRDLRGWAADTGSAAVSDQLDMLERVHTESRTRSGAARLPEFSARVSCEEAKAADVA